MSFASSCSVACITGAHRSGTSMLAQLLHACGLYLGTPSELMEPSDDNPEGFWEHLGFVGLNDAILHEFGGSWDLPTPVPLFQPDNSRFHSFEEEALRLIGSMRAFGSWGWKDPRNCLTLPFWRRVVPELRIVVIVRHPFEVAASLHARNGFSHTLGYHLWHTYNERVIGAGAEAILVTNYNSFFSDARHEVARILEHLRFPKPVGAEAKLDPLVSTLHRHHYATRQMVANANIPKDVLELYDALVTKSGGPHSEEFRSSPKRKRDKPRLPPAEIIGADDLVADLTQQLVERTAWAEQLDDELTRVVAQRTAWVQELEADLARTRKVVDELQETVRERTEWAQTADRENSKTTAALANVQRTLDEGRVWVQALLDERDQARARAAQLESELERIVAASR